MNIFVRSFNISNNNITDSELTYLVGALEQNETMTSFDLSRNNISKYWRVYTFGWIQSEYFSDTHWFTPKLVELCDEIEVNCCQYTNRWFQKKIKISDAHLQSHYRRSIIYLMVLLLEGITAKQQN